MGPVFSLLVSTQLGFIEPSFLRAAAEQQAIFDQMVVGLPAADRQGAALVAFVRNLGLTHEEHERAGRLIEELGDERYRVRDRATRDLLSMKSAARSLLQDVLRDADQERRRRAELCLPVLESRST